MHIEGLSVSNYSKIAYQMQCEGLYVKIYLINYEMLNRRAWGTYIN